MPSSFFWRFLVFLVKFSYWSKFHVNIITCSGVMTISFYKGLTRNLEIGNTPVWVLPNIWRLERVRKTKFGKNVSDKILLCASKFQGCSFYRFWVIKRKPTGGKITPLPTPTPRLGLNKKESEAKYKLTIDNNNIESTKSIKLLRITIDDRQWFD